jgi:cytochrome oxidase assembly protein ShyY1
LYLSLACEPPWEYARSWRLEIYANIQFAEPDWSETLEMEAKGVPIGRAAEVNLRNNHAQYIFTW